MADYNKLSLQTINTEPELEYSQFSISDILDSNMKSVSQEFSNKNVFPVTGSEDSNSYCGEFKVQSNKYSRFSNIDHSFPLKESQSSDRSVKMFGDSRSLQNFDDTSQGTNDLYMMKLHQMLHRDEELKCRINELEQRETAFIKTIEEAKNTWENVENGYQTRIIKVKDNISNLQKQFDRRNEQISANNKRLAEEVKGAKLGLKRCMERMLNPMSEKLELEKRRSEMLQKNLIMANNGGAPDFKQENELNYMKNKLQSSCENMCELHSANTQLQRQLQLLENRCTELTGDLTLQKQNEARTINKIKEANPLFRDHMDK